MSEAGQAPVIRLPEIIVRAAIVVGDAVYSVPQPGRHGTIYRELEGSRGAGPDQQGFLTSHGRFVDRVEALHLASAAGQIKEKTGSARILFSEDVW